ncbi:MAG: outer membrane lipoprotein chaperone LolA [Cellvibrionales bacterium]
MRPLIGPRWRWWLVSLLCVWLAIGIARGGKAATPLQQIDQLAGRFTQQLFDENGQLLIESAGEFALLRPYYFRWEIQQPGKQLLVGDGEFLWQYDKDLATVSRRPLADQLGTPLGVLLAGEGELERAYQVEREANVLKLTPREPNPLFASIVIQLKDGLPRELTLVDSLGQNIKLLLVLSPDQGLKPADFAFQPPADVDLTVVGS